MSYITTFDLVRVHLMVFYLESVEQVGVVCVWEVYLVRGVGDGL